jgi:hypothetical protein
MNVDTSNGIRHWDVTPKLRNARFREVMQVRQYVAGKGWRVIRVETWKVRHQIHRKIQVSGVPARVVSVLPPAESS